MERGDLTQIVRRKIEDIQKLIKNSDKDSNLRKQLDSQLTEILTEEHKIGRRGGKIRKEDPSTLITRLVNFRSYILNRLRKSSVIRCPKVILVPLSLSKVQMRRLSSIQNEGGESADSSSDNDLFQEVRIKKKSITFTGRNGFGTNNLPEKRIRKQVVRPDFVSSFKKIKMEREQREDKGESSNEGESPPASSNGLAVEFPCPVCKKIFRKKGHMTRHLLTHEPEKPFPCEIAGCTKRFAAKYSLQMHLLNRHNTDAKPFLCTHCHKRFTLNKELQQHELSHKEGRKISYPCNLCELKFLTKDDLDSHLETHPEANIYHCGHCDKSFPRKYNLTRHERTHSTEKPYHCDACHKDFGTKNGLHMHLQAHETDENKPLSCHLCNKRFTIEQNLELHISFHNQSDEKPFPCDLCEVRFKTQERLEKHFETHGSIEGRVYPCQYCEKTFPRKYNLVRHELSHTHGRRKPKDGLPTSIRHDYRHGYESDEENDGGMGSETYFNENQKNGFEENNRYTYSYDSISKSELFTTFFGVGEGFFTDNDDSTPPFSSEHYSVVKFENY